MKIVIITQEDGFVVPANIKKIIDNNNFFISLIVVIKSEHSLERKKMHFMKGFGFFQSLKMGFYLFLNIIYDFFDKLSYHKILKKSKSIYSISKKHNISYFEIDNPNNDSFISYLKKNSPDIIVSFSAPVVFKNKLLSIPKKGCINLHCSYLPSYSGLMPSFWALYNKESYTGVSIHYMDDKIDNGDILSQSKVKIKKDISIFELIKLTKSIGGDLMVKLLEDIQSEKELSIKKNFLSLSNYFTWPSISQLKDFKKRGGKLI